MSTSDLFGYRVFDKSSDNDDSSDSTNFTLKFTPSEGESEIDDQEVQLCINDEDLENSSTKSEINATNISVNPVFDSSHLKRGKASTTSLRCNNNRLRTFSNTFGNNSLSEESDCELRKFKKITKAHKVFFSSDDEEESLTNIINNVNPGQTEAASNYPQHNDERRVTRSQTLRKKRLIQKQVFNQFKQKRSLTTKSLVPVVCLGRSYAPLNGSKLLQKELREMKLFRFL